MQRRNFLQIIGAAIAAPLMPSASFGSVAKVAPYTPAALHGAILHAQSRCSISSWSLAQTLGVPVAQANALMADMIDRGILGNLRGSAGGSRWASSKVFKPAFAPYQPRVTARMKHNPSCAVTHHTQPDLSLMMAHLRDISSRYFAAQAA